MKKNIGITLALTAATLLTSCESLKNYKQTNKEPKSAQVKCYGINSCKGMGSCATNLNACKGYNSCKNKGIIETNSEKECIENAGEIIVD